MTSEVITTVEKGVRVIRINRPKTKNAFSSYVYTTITRILTEDANNDDVVVTILTGTGEFYSSGTDLMDAMAHGNEDKGQLDEVQAMIHAFISYPKLLIALINGHAVGIAVTTAGLCDVIYASERATFHAPFVNLGLCAEGCSSYTFPRIFGRSKASEVLLLGKKITAQEAYQFGFVAEVVPHNKFDDFFNELKTLGRKLTANSVKINKKLILDNYKNVLCECCDREVKQLEECFQSQEFGDAVVKFMSRKSKL